MNLYAKFSPEYSTAFKIRISSELQQFHIQPISNSHDVFSLQSFSD